MKHSKFLRVEVVSRETIKPSSSPSQSSHQQESFKLSLLDQFAGHHYVPTLLFYKNATCPRAGVNEISHRLKSSLSETLTRFYPFAGRLKDPLTISCTDEGVDYSEARVLNCSLFDVLEKPDQNQLQLLIPTESPCLTTSELLLIQVSFFECGGISLGMKFSHKVADAATFCSFINSWADSALRGNFNPATPDFTASTLFPPMDSLPPSAHIQPNHNNKPSVVRTSRFVFGPSELVALQANAASTNNPRPTRFEAVTSFIWKTALLSAEKESRPSELIWAVNMRSKLHPHLSENCFGNLLGFAMHEVGVDGNDMSSLASYIRRGTIDICNDFAQALKGGDSTVPGILELQIRRRNLFDEMIAGNIRLYRVTSWCKMPFYEADFGWGKPLWVTDGGTDLTSHMMVLMDTRDGNGIEVNLSLTEEEMTLFESNQELKNYAAFNPSAFS